MARFAPIVAAAAATAFFLHHSDAWAQSPPTVTDAFAVLTNDSANDGNFGTGTYYYIQAFNGLPSSNVTAPAITTSPTFASTAYGFMRQGSTNESLFTKPEPTHPNEIAASVPYSTGLSGAWTLHVSSTSNFATGTVTLATTNSLVGVVPMPFVQSMTISPGTNPLTPTVSWMLPASTPGTSINEEVISVSDNSAPIQRYNINPFSSTDAVKPYGVAFSQAGIEYKSLPISNTTSNFQVPATNNNPNNVNAGNIVLQYGHTYTIGISLENSVGPAVPGCQLCNVDTRSISNFDYTPINPQSLGLPANAVINMPSTTPIPTTSGLFAGPVYSFSVGNVSSSSVTYIDPLAADGFIYTIGQGDPNFASVDPITDIGAGAYELAIWNGTGFTPDGTINAGQTVDFGPGGVTEFEITGIDPGVDPTDISAFVTGLTFTGPGSFTGTMQPIVVQTTPLPAASLLMLTGIFGFGFLIYRSKRREPLGLDFA